MKNYTVNEAREILRKYFRKLSGELSGSEVPICYMADCDECVFQVDDIHCDFTIHDNEYIAKAEEFINEVDWSRVSVDTKILVRDGDEWEKRYFGKYEDGKVCAWNNGCTSWSANSYTEWPEAKLSEGEDE